jgi:hypothetical protein
VNAPLLCEMDRWIKDFQIAKLVSSYAFTQGIKWLKFGEIYQVHAVNEFPAEWWRGAFLHR